MLTENRIYLITATFIILFTGIVSAQSGDVDAQISKADDLYWRGQFEDAVILTSSLLAESELKPEQEKHALMVLARCEANRGQDKATRAYLERLAKLDPAIELNPDEYPPQMMSIWYSVERDLPDSLRPSVMGKTTIAILPFDNASISEDQRALDPRSVGLASMMIQDISKSDKLKVVDRDKINFIVDELELQQSDLVDKSTAVKMGKLVGAQTLLMGSFMKISKNDMKIFGRLVSVETSEILKAAEVTGDPDDIFELQKELVLKVLGELNVDVDKDTKKKINEGKDNRYEALYHYSLGLALQDKKEYKAAYAEFSRALELAPNYAEAARKKNRLEPMAMKG